MPRPGRRWACGLALVLLAAAGCTGGAQGRSTPVGSTTSDRPVPPRAGVVPTGTGVDYQLGGAYPLPDGVGIVVRDREAEPAAGAWSVCYLNAFQTQPGERERWSGANADLVLRDDAGAPVHDPGWPDEWILDTSDPGKRDRIAAELAADLRGCAEAGFDAVELDNLDSYTRLDGLTLEGNAALAAALVRTAHEAGLAVGQKNAPEDAARLHAQAGFDFAVAESCVRYEECAAYTRVYGTDVIDIEYVEEGMTRADLCAASDRPAASVLRDRALVPVGAAGYVRAAC